MIGKPTQFRGQGVSGLPSKCDTPRPKKKRRPATLDTVNAWLGLMEPSGLKESISSMLVVYTAPYIKCQEAKVAMVFKADAWKTAVEVVGPEAFSLQEYQHFISDINEEEYYRLALEAFGGHIYGAFQQVAQRYGCELSAEEVLKHRDAQSYSQQKEQAQAAAIPHMHR